MGKSEQEILQALVSPLGERTGNGFFTALSKSLSETLDVDLTMIVELDQTKTHANTVCAYEPGREVGNFSYPLATTPCENVARASTCYYPERVAELFPEDEELTDQGFQSYCGTPLIDSKGDTIGLICVLSREPMSDEPVIKATLELVAHRASAELERLQYEKELLDARLAAEKADQIKSDFIANVSHDLRAPLNGILGFSRLLQQANLEDKLSEYVNNIHSSGEYLVGLIDDLLDLTSIENGSIRLVEETCLIDELLETILPDMKMLAQSKGLFLETTIMGDLRPILLDRKRMRQILMNLVSNAIKYTEHGMVHLHVEQGEKALVMSVTDTGPGIEPVDQDRVFERFTRLNQDQNEQVPGFGIGLSITRDLVELMKGQIGLESHPGKGSRFWVEIPISRQVDQFTEEAVGDNSIHAA